MSHSLDFTAFHSSAPCPRLILTTNWWYYMQGLAILCFSLLEDINIKVVEMQPWPWLCRWCRAPVTDLVSNRHTKSERAWSCNPDDLACLWGWGNLVKNRGVHIRNKQALAKITFIVAWDHPRKGLSLHPFLWACVLLLPGRLGLPSAYIYIFIGLFITGLPKHFTHLHLESLL